MTTRPLAPELQAKAMAELNEDPRRISEDIQHIKDWLTKQSHLKARTDDQFILTFLRGAKFSLERTKEKLEVYYTMRSLLPEFFTNRDPFEPNMQELMKQGIILPLSKTSAPDAPKGYLFRFGRWNTSRIPFEEVMKLNLMILDILSIEDDQGLIAGLMVLSDCTDLNINHMMNMNPSVFKKGTMYFQDALPNRPKGLHYFKPPTFIETILNLFLPFMNEKLRKRNHIHNTKNINDMYEVFPKAILPAEYGGDAGPLQEEIDFWRKKVESYAAWFKEDEAYYGCDESKLSGNPKTTSYVFGLEGSFRKLNVD